MTSGTKRLRRCGEKCWHSWRVGCELMGGMGKLDCPCASPSRISPTRVRPCGLTHATRTRFLPSPLLLNWVIHALLARDHEAFHAGLEVLPLLPDLVGLVLDDS